MVVACPGAADGDGDDAGGQHNRGMCQAPRLGVRTVGVTPQSAEPASQVCSARVHGVPGAPALSG